MRDLRVMLVALTLLSCSDEARRAAPPPRAPAPSPAARSAPPIAKADTGTPEAERCAADAGRLCPVDEAAAEPSFSQYRERLREAVREKSESKLLALVDPHVRTTFGEGGGIADLKGQWRTGSPDSGIWKELGLILDLGGTFGDGEGRRSFWAPYVYSAWPDNVDAFEHVAAIRSGVAIREHPDPNAVALTTVDWSILELTRKTGGIQYAAWKRVRAPNGTEGWVAAADVRSPIDFRAGFNLVDGQWKMTALVAGD